MKRMMAVVLSMTLMAGVLTAQDQPGPTKATTAQAQKTATAKAPQKKAAAKKAEPTVSEQLDEMRQQIKQLSNLIESRDQKIDQLEQKLDKSQTVAVQAQTKADSAVAQTAADEQAVLALKNDFADFRTVSMGGSNGPVLRNTVWALQDPTQMGSDDKGVYNKDMESPITIRFKGIHITPGGFAAAEFVRRSRELGADIITPFNNLTMPGASQNNLSDFFGTARQSRPTVYVEGKVGNVDLSSYISGDFLSSGTTSNNTQTDSYTLRLRQVWGQAKFDNGWKFLGGQAWSLVTENKVGIGPSDDTGRTNDARPQTIDGQYNVGFSFARQYGIRLTKDFGDKVSVAFAMENAQGTLTTHNNVSNYLLGEAGATNTNNAFNGTYTANPAPDLIAKIAFDPGFGHYEIFGLVDRFTDRVFPCAEGFATNPVCAANPAAASTLGVYNASKEGGGVGANARWAFADKHFVFGLHGFGGSGVGRYGASQLSDLSIHADGTIHLIRDLQGLITLEYHSKKLDLYSYVGAEYAGRAYDFDSISGKYVGYGSPFFNNYGCYEETLPGSGGFSPGSLANCTGDTRATIEGTAGFWYNIYTGPKGRFRFGTQYSYVTRQTWAGISSQPNTPVTYAGPEGLDGMVFTSFRYYLP
jgi:hypothetical protein